MLRRTGLLLALLVLLSTAPDTTGAALGPARNLSWLSDEGSGITHYTLSPDGRYVAYTIAADIINPYRTDNRYDLYLAPTAGGPPRRLTPVQQDFPGIDNGEFSPDSRYLVYWLSKSPGEGPGLYSVPVAGGEPVRLDRPAAQRGGFAITPDGSRVVFDGLASVPITGGPMTRLYQGPFERFVLTRDGRYAVFTGSPEGVSQLFSVPLTGGQVVRLDTDEGVLEHTVVAPNGRRVFYRTVGGELYAVDVDGGRRVMLDRGGKLGPEPLQATASGYTVFYPRGHQTQQGQDIAAVADTGGKVRLLGVAERGYDLYVETVTPDGRRVLYTSRRSGMDPTRIYSVPTAGGQRVRLPGEGDIVVRAQRNKLPPVTSDSGRFVYIVNDEAKGRGMLYSAAVGSGKGAALVSQPIQNGVSDIRYALSPDGALVAYIVPSGPNGFYEIFVAPTAGGAATKVAGPFQYVGWDVDVLGFTPDSRSLLYVAGQDRPTIFDLYIVPVR